MMVISIIILSTTHLADNTALSLNAKLSLVMYFLYVLYIRFYTVVLLFIVVCSSQQPVHDGDKNIYSSTVLKGSHFFPVEITLYFYCTIIQLRTIKYCTYYCTELVFDSFSYNVDFIINT